MFFNCEPGKGIHSIRVLDFAIVDVLFTLLAAFLIGNPTVTFPILIILGIIVHYAFGIDTKLNRLIFNNHI